MEGYSGYDDSSVPDNISFVRFIHRYNDINYSYNSISLGPTTLKCSRAYIIIDYTEVKCYNIYNIL